jgi:hypothetical protein
MRQVAPHRPLGDHKGPLSHASFALATTVAAIELVLFKLLQLLDA